MNYQDPDFTVFLRAVVKNGLRHPSYVECCDHASQMSVHLYGTKPFTLLNRVRPREDIETKSYRIESYEATTKSTAGKALSILAKMFNPVLYSIRWKDQTSDGEKLENYTMKEYPEFNSVVNFLSDSLLKKMLSDPNGILAVRPVSLNIDQTETPEAIAKVYGSANLYYYDDEMYLILIKVVKAIKPPYGDIYFFEYYDGTNIIDFSFDFPNPNEKANILDQVVYPHGCDKIPVWQLRGTPELMDNGMVLFKSFFDDALPHWNLAVTHESDLFGAFINHLHPLRAELAEECDYKMGNQRCQRGKINNVDEQGVVIGGVSTCPSCNGSGYRSVKSPYGVYMYNKEKLQEGTTSLTPVQYITVPTEATAMLEKRVDKMHEKGLNAINMDIVNKVGENQSGKAKVIDRSELNDFLYKIASVMFDIHLPNIFYFFNSIMFKVANDSKPNSRLEPDKLSKNLPIIQKPVNFDIMTESELLADLDSSTKAGLSPEYIRQAQKQLLAKKFATSPDIARIMNLVVDLDPVPEYTVDHIIALQAGAQKMWPTEWEIIHFNIGQFVCRALEEDEEFANKDRDQQMVILTGYAKEVMTATKVNLNPSIPPETVNVHA